MSEPLPPPRLLTIGLLAARLGVSISRVEYILRTRPHIKPRAYAGFVRVFCNETIALVRHEINAIDAQRMGCSQGDCIGRNCPNYTIHICDHCDGSLCFHHAFEMNSNAWLCGDCETVYQHSGGS